MNALIGATGEERQRLQNSMLTCYKLAGSFKLTFCIAIAYSIGPSIEKKEADTVGHKDRKI